MGSREEVGQGGITRGGCLRCVVMLVDMLTILTCVLRIEGCGDGRYKHKFHSKFQGRCVWCMQLRVIVMVQVQEAGMAATCRGASVMPEETRPIPTYPARWLWTASTSPHPLEEGTAVSLPTYLAHVAADGATHAHAVLRVLHKRGAHACADTCQHVRNGTRQLQRDRNDGTRCHGNIHACSVLAPSHCTCDTYRDMPIVGTAGDAEDAGMTACVGNLQRSTHAYLQFGELASELLHGNPAGIGSQAAGFCARLRHVGRVVRQTHGSLGAYNKATQPEVNAAAWQADKHLSTSVCDTSRLQATPFPHGRVCNRFATLHLSCPSPPRKRPLLDCRALLLL